MPKVELSVVPEGDGVHRPGETVRGVVEVRVDEECPEAVLTARCRWSTDGKGTTDSAVLDEVELYRGPWLPGATLRYPYTFTAPPGPFSSEGEVVSVRWEVAARVDLPWAIDPKASAPWRLVGDPGRPPEPAALYPNPREIPKAVRNAGPGLAEASSRPTPGAVQAPKWVGILILGAILAAIVWGLVTAVGVVAALFSGGLDAFGWVFVGLAAFAIVSVIVAVARRIGPELAGRARLRDLEVDVSPRVVRPGGELRVRLRAIPKREIAVGGATVSLVARERAVRGSGKNRTVSTATAREIRAELSPPRTAHAGLPFELVTTVALPADTPPSFGGRNNRVAWAADVHLDIEGWPDWKRSVPFVLHP